jgi:hypothetical protein
MHFFVQSSVLLCFIATQFLGYNAGVVPTDIQCDGGKCLPKLTLPILHDLQRRASGGGGGGGKGGGETGGAGGTSGGDGGSSGTEGGLSDGNQETEGDLGENCPRKRSWSHFWTRSPCIGSGGGSSSQDDNLPPSIPVTNPPANNAPANNPAATPPSVRTNNNQAAQSQAQNYTPACRITIASKVSEFKDTIRTRGLENGPWFFYS